MDAGLGVRIALHADGLARAFAGAGIGFSALPADRESHFVPSAAIAIDIHQSFDVGGNIPPEISLHLMFLFNDIPDANYFGLCKFLSYTELLV